MGRKKQFYVARIARNPGIFSTWAECQKEIEGFPGSGGGNMKGFGNQQEALDFFTRDEQGRPLGDLEAATAYWSQQSKGLGQDVQSVPREALPQASSKEALEDSQQSNVAQAVPRSSGRFYAARIARNPGIFSSWAECENEIRGFPGSGRGNMKCFDSWQEALDFFTTDGQGEPLGDLESAKAYWKQQSERSREGSYHVEVLNEAVPESHCEEDVFEGLDEQQRHTMELVKAGRNVVITGGAGVGKTFLTQRVCSFLRQRYCHDFHHRVAVTASTGAAAVLVGGVTLHSATGVGVAGSTRDFRRIHSNEQHQKLWQGLEVLLVDEASMIAGEFLDRLDAEVRLVRGDDSPFGGIQVILIGDFLQLQPIANSPPKDLQEKDEAFLNRGMVFQSAAFQALDFCVVELQQVHRQSGDPGFAALLNRVREGEACEEDLEGLNARCMRPLPPALTPLLLFARNEDVKATNEEKLQALSGQSTAYTCRDIIKVLPDGDAEIRVQRRRAAEKSAFWENCQGQRQVELKVNAQVMLVANVNTHLGLVNGALGEVIAFKTITGLPDVPKYAQEEVSQWLEALPGPLQLPVVRFRRSGRSHLVPPWLFEADIPGAGKCQRVQVPLKLGWAITHHKAQGCTVDVAEGEGARVDPESFTEGQAYVALSRVTEERGLELLKPLRPRTIKVSTVALSFYAALRALSKAQGALPNSWARLPPRMALVEAKAARHPGADAMHRSLKLMGALGHWSRLPR